MKKIIIPNKMTFNYLKWESNPIAVSWILYSTALEYL